MKDERLKDGAQFSQHFVNDDAFCERSWGMSDDYRIACETRSTMVRIGTAIFGPRIY